MSAESTSLVGPPHSTVRGEHAVNRAGDPVLHVALSQAEVVEVAVRFRRHSGNYASMCYEYELETKWEEYSRIMAREALDLPSRQTEADLALSPSIKIGDTGTVIAAAGNAAELAPMKFGFPPARKGAGPVFNFRSEGRRFGDSNRCLIPASAFSSSPAAKYPKTRHRFWMEGEPCFAIAAIWREGDDGAKAFSMLTTEPGPDVAPIHDRQIVILQPGQWAAWLYLTLPEADLLQPAPAGTLSTAISPRQ